MSPRAVARRLARFGLRGWALSALGAAMLMWTAVANGRPPVFTDTALYYAQGEYLFEALHLVSPAQAVSPPGDPTALPATPGAPSISASIDGARSPLYGAPVYALQRLGGLWLVAFAQAWVAAGMIYLLYRASAPAATRWGYLALMAGLAALTPLPFFASWIMPDVFAGVAGCGLLLILVYGDRLGRARLAGAAVLTAYGLAVHRSNLLDACAVAIAALLLLRLAGTPWRRVIGRFAILAAIAMGASLATALAYMPIRARAGEPIGSPPFLSARVLADGPGRIFLRQTCAVRPTRFVLCAFQDRPLANSDQILWSNRRRNAVFLAAGPAMRLDMEHQDTGFAEAEVLAEPVGQAWASAGNAVQQFTRAYVDDPLKAQGFYVADPYWRHTVLPRIVPDASACQQPGACAPHVSKAASRLLEEIGLAASTAILAWRLSARDVRDILRRRTNCDWREPRVRLLVAFGLVASLLIANAIVCGVLSGPFPRYQARIVWLLPMMAGLSIAVAGWRRRRVKSDERSFVYSDMTPPTASLDAAAGSL